MSSSQENIQQSTIGTVPASKRDDPNPKQFTQVLDSPRSSECPLPVNSLSTGENVSKTAIISGSIFPLFSSSTTSKSSSSDIIRNCKIYPTFYGDYDEKNISPSYNQSDSAFVDSTLKTKDHSIQVPDSPTGHMNFIFSLRKKLMPFHESKEETMECERDIGFKPTYEFTDRNLKKPLAPFTLMFVPDESKSVSFTSTATTDSGSTIPVSRRETGGCRACGSRGTSVTFEPSSTKPYNPRKPRDESERHFVSESSPKPHEPPTKFRKVYSYNEREEDLIAESFKRPSSGRKGSRYSSRSERSLSRQTTDSSFSTTSSVDRVAKGNFLIFFFIFFTIVVIAAAIFAIIYYT